MALKITVQRVAPGTVTDQSLQLKTLVTTPNDLPFTVVIPEESSDVGATAAHLRLLCGLMLKAKFNTDITAIVNPASTSLADALSMAYLEHINPIV